MDPADQLVKLIRRRLKLRPDHICCPRERSEMTPCAARDGSCAVATGHGQDKCVGCGTCVAELLDTEKAKH